MSDTKNKLPLSSLHPTGWRCGTCALLMLGVAAPDSERKCHISFPESRYCSISNLRCEVEMQLFLKTHYQHRTAPPDCK